MPQKGEFFSYSHPMMLKAEPLKIPRFAHLMKYDENLENALGIPTGTARGSATPLGVRARFGVRAPAGSAGHRNGDEKRPPLGVLAEHQSHFHSPGISEESGKICNGSLWKKQGRKTY